jgi:hypothetical protein
VPPTSIPITHEALVEDRLDSAELGTLPALKAIESDIWKHHREKPQEKQGAFRDTNTLHDQALPTGIGY